MERYSRCRSNIQELWDSPEARCRAEEASMVLREGTERKEQDMGEEQEATDPVDGGLSVQSEVSSECGSGELSTSTSGAIARNLLARV